MNKGNLGKNLMDEAQQHLEQKKVDDEFYAQIVESGFDQLLKNSTRENALIAYRREWKG